MCRLMGIIFCGNHPFLLTRIQVSDPGPMYPFVLEYAVSVKQSVPSSQDLGTKY